MWVSYKFNFSKAFKREMWCWISFTLWIIWKARCEVIYDHVAPNPIGTVHRIGAAVAEFLGAMVLPLPISPNVVDSTFEQEIK